MEFIRAKDGTERVILDVAEFQALLDAASASAHGLPDVGPVIRELKVALASREDYVDAGELLDKYDATHGAS